MIAKSYNDDQKFTIGADPEFKAIQISQMMMLECGIIKRKILNDGGEQVLELITNLESQAKSIGKMMQEIRKKKAVVCRAKRIQ
jgi:hypothetical protein